MNWRTLPGVHFAWSVLQQRHFDWLARGRDVAADPISEFWITFDLTPPRPSVISAAREIFVDRFIAKVVADMAALGPAELDYLRRDLVGACRRAAWGDR